MLCSKLKLYRAKDCPIEQQFKAIDQTSLWRWINNLPEDCQHRIGQLFVGNKRWAGATRAARTARLQQEEEKNRKANDAFWQERMFMMCGT